MLHRIGSTAFYSLLLLIAGCETEYEKHYTSALQGKPLSDFSDIEPSFGSPTLQMSTDIVADGQKMLESGDLCIGYSVFSGSDIKTDDALAFAKKIGAARVLVQKNYVGTERGTSTMTLRNADQQITTYSQGNIYGHGGSATYSGNSTTVVPGGYSSYQIPYSVDVYSHAATFWVKAKPSVLGVIPGDLSDQQKISLQTNKGVVVTAVTRQSPAFNADILKGDILLGIESESFTDCGSFQATVSKYASRTVTLRFVRGGVPRQIVITLNPAS